jgi:hypothetical protein
VPGDYFLQPAGENEVGERPFYRDFADLAENGRI